MPYLTGGKNEKNIVGNTALEETLEDDIEGGEIGYSRLSVPLNSKLYRLTLTPRRGSDSLFDGFIGLKTFSKLVMAPGQTVFYVNLRTAITKFIDFVLPTYYVLNQEYAPAQFKFEIPKGVAKSSGRLILQEFRATMGDAPILDEDSEFVVCD